MKRLDQFCDDKHTFNAFAVVVVSCFIDQKQVLFFFSQYTPLRWTDWVENFAALALLPHIRFERGNFKRRLAIMKISIGTEVTPKIKLRTYQSKKWKYFNSMKPAFFLRPYHAPPYYRLTNSSHRMQFSNQYQYLDFHALDRTSN